MFKFIIAFALLITVPVVASAAPAWHHRPPAVGRPVVEPTCHLHWICHHHHYQHRHHSLNPIVEGLGIGLAYMLDSANQRWSTTPPSAMLAYERLPEGDSRPFSFKYSNTVPVPPEGWPTKPFKHDLPTAIVRGLGSSQIVGHPSGCPRTAFCGCGAAAYLGLHDRSLWLAANWIRRFPRALPAVGMVAARWHHVMVILNYLGGDKAVAYDANSGHHQTRIHEVSLRGYTILNPGGRRYASR